MMKSCPLVKYSLAGIALLLASCGGGGGNGGDGTIPGPGETQQVTIQPEAGGTIALASGASVSFPANTFEQPTIIIFSDNIVGPEREANTYPAGATSFFAYVTLNNPATAENAFHRDITLTFALRDTIAPGTKFWVFRYDDDSVKWVNFATTVATVGPTGALATAVLPTSGIDYYIGSLGIFTELLASEGTLPGGAAAILTGVVTDSASGDPVPDLDISLYLISGGEELPHDFLNGEEDPDNPNCHNVTYTDADGRYQIELGEGDIGSGIIYLLRLARILGDYEEVATSTFSVSAGVNPDKNLVVTPVE